MLLSKRKIETIHQMFTAPYRPTIINIDGQNQEIEVLNKMKNSIKYSHTVTNKYKSNTLEIKKSSFPLYNKNTISTISIDNNDYNNNNYYTINYDTYDTNYQYYYPLKREIIINNPEDIIESGVLKSTVKREGTSSIYEEKNINQFNTISMPISNQQPNIDMQNNLPQIMPQNNIEPTNEIDKIIPGELTETVQLPQNNLESEVEPEAEADVNVVEEKKETPIEEQTPVMKKYILCSGKIVALPEIYSTDDEDEYNAVNTLNEDISSWKKYTDNNGIKLYFKPYPVKDEDGKDCESVIGYCEAILDFPASKVIQKMNDFEFRKTVDDQYKKGKLLSERTEGNIKIMEMYLYMKMPFIFSDRDFVVTKKCWLDYNGNKDHALFYIHSTENPEYPAKKKPVRGNYANRSGYIKPLSDNQCQLNVITAMDVKMSLGYDTMAKNGVEMQEKWVTNLRKQLAK